MALTEDQISLMKEDLSSELAEILMEEWHYSMVEALEILYNSDTFALLQDTATGLYYQSPGYVYSFLEEEMIKGRVA